MSHDAEDRGRTARGLLELLYPPPNQVDHGSGAERARFVAIPHARAPRLLVDAGSPRLAAAALRRHSRSPRLTVRAARYALSVATRTGLYDRLPGARVIVHGPEGAATIVDPLRQILGCADVAIAMSIGPRRANRKPVLEVADSRGETLAFVKVGHNDLTRSLVEDEGRALVTLNAHEWRELRVPRVLASTDWNGLALLVLEPLSLPRRGCEDALGRERLHAVVNEIATKTDDVVLPWHSHPLRQRLQQRLSSSGSAEPWLRQLERLPADMLIRTGGWHGDLNPGNMFLSSGACPVWDWERFEHDVPVGFDLLHHDLQSAITKRHTDPSVAATELLRAAPCTLARWAPDPRQALAVCRAYLIVLADRYLADDQAGAGAALGRVNEWLLPVLEACPDDVS